jgi:hypothetical protein
MGGYLRAGFSEAGLSRQCCRLNANTIHSETSRPEVLELLRSLQICATL